MELDDRTPNVDLYRSQDEQEVGMARLLSLSLTASAPAVLSSSGRPRAAWFSCACSRCQPCLRAAVTATILVRPLRVATACARC